ncbi:hypothetical protein SVIOM342S_09518 [Streptomyces violaceorubidus]
MVGASQVKFRQTYAAAAPPTRGRSASSGNSSLPATPKATTAPGAVPSSAVRCSPRAAGSFGSAATTATSRGPSSSASAAASPQPMKRGTRGPSAFTTPRARSAAVRWGAEPVWAAYDSRAPAAALQPDGVALSVGSCGRRISCSASAAVSYSEPDSSVKRVRTWSSRKPAKSSQTPSPVTDASARKPSATSA